MICNCHWDFFRVTENTSTKMIVVRGQVLLYTEATFLSEILFLK